MSPSIQISRKRVLVVATLDPRTFACGGAGLLGFVVFILLVAEQDSRYVEDKSDQIQVTRGHALFVVDRNCSPSALLIAQRELVADSPEQHCCLGPMNGRRTIK